MTGTLGLFSLVDLFQLLASSSRTGRLVVDHPRGAARVYFDKGQVVHADFAGVRGEEAVFALFADERGKFEFKLGMPAPETSIRRKTENLMIDAVRLLDEARRDVASSAPSVDDEDVLAFKDEALRDEGAAVPERRSLQTADARVLHFVDGRRNLRQVASESKLPLEEVRGVLARFLARGELELRPRKPRTVRLLAGLSRAPLPPQTVGLAANLLAEWNRVLGAEVETVACRRPDGQVFVYAAQGVAVAGGHILFSRDTLLSSNLAANTELLVRPYQP